MRYKDNPDAGALKQFAAWQKHTAFEYACGISAQLTAEVNAQVVAFCTEPKSAKRLWLCQV